jgi:mannose-6-phosphate isomerase-like protein (cupin superfamily)
MAGFVTDIESATRQNDNFRKVIFTAPHSQLVLMTLQPGEEIGMEVHNNVDQFFRIEVGQGKVVIDGQETPIKDGSAIVVPAGSMHNVVNTGKADLKLYTIYSPPEHRDKVVHGSKADVFEEHFDGKTTE